MIIYRIVFLLLTFLLEYDSISKSEIEINIKSRDYTPQMSSYITEYPKIYTDSAGSGLVVCFSKKPITSQEIGVFARRDIVSGRLEYCVHSFYIFEKKMK